MSSFKDASGLVVKVKELNRLLEANSTLKEKLTQVKEILGCQEGEADGDLTFPGLDFA